MASINIYQGASDSVTVTINGHGLQQGAWITVRFGDDVMIYLRGTDAEAAATARTLAAALIAAADQLSQLTLPIGLP